MFAKLNPLFKLLKAEVPKNIASELEKNFDSMNQAPIDASELAIKQPILEEQLTLMTDSSFMSDGCALMIKDNQDQKIQSESKAHAPVAFGSKIFSLAQLKMSNYSNELLST